MIPYFPGIIEILKVYLTEEQSDDTICIQTQAIGEYVALWLYGVKCVEVVLIKNEKCNVILIFGFKTVTTTVVELVHKMSQTTCSVN